MAKCLQIHLQNRTKLFAEIVHSLPENKKTIYITSNEYHLHWNGLDIQVIEWENVINKPDRFLDMSLKLSTNKRS